MNPRKLLVPVLVAPLVLAGCGGGSSQSAVRVKGVTGEGFFFAAPVDWRVTRGVRSVAAQQGNALVSVTVFSLSRPFQPTQWRQAVQALDGVAKQYALDVHTRVEAKRTETVAHRSARVYDLSGDRRLGFVLAGRREFQLFCRAAGDACDRLFSSFDLVPTTPTITLPPATAP